MEQLLQHISQLESSCSSLEQLITSSCAGTERLQEEKESLQTENEQLQADNNMLVREIKKMQTEIDRLQTLQSEYDQLQAEKDQLQAEKDQLQAEKDQLETKLKSVVQAAEQQNAQDSEGGEQPADFKAETSASEGQSSNHKQRRNTKKKKETDPNQMQIPFDF